MSPVLGIDGKNPKSRAVPPGFRSTCGQEPASSTDQTAKITAALTLEDQIGLFQTLSCRFQEKMLIKQTLYIGVPYFERGLRVVTSTAVCSHLFTCSSAAVQEPEAGPKALETCLIELYLVFVSLLLFFTHLNQ